MSKERVVVAMSGGVDSAVASYLLQQQGYDVIGMTMLVWSPPGVDMNHLGSCCGVQAAEDARRVAGAIGFPHYAIDVKDVFYDEIVRDYVEEYRQGRTPNPCIRCNELIKFDLLFRKAQAMGANLLATGHYARVRYDEERRRWLLLRGVDAQKDQSYALYRLTQEQLSRTLFPLGEMTKPEVRKIARELDLGVASKPDSQETCFVPDNDYPSLLKILAPETATPGDILSVDGEVLGKHPGTAFYTIGQRRRLGVYQEHPLYVAEIDPRANTLTVTEGDDPRLFRREVIAKQPVLVSTGNLKMEAKRSATARVRYNMTDQPGLVWMEDDDCLRFRFDESVRAISPGQSLVCYEGDEVLAGGIIQ